MKLSGGLVPSKRKHDHCLCIRTLNQLPSGYDVRCRWKVGGTWMCREKKRVSSCRFTRIGSMAQQTVASTVDFGGSSKRRMFLFRTSGLCFGMGSGRETAITEKLRRIQFRDHGRISILFQVVRDPVKRCSLPGWSWFKKEWRVSPSSFLVLNHHHDFQKYILIRPFVVSNE